MQSQQSQQSQEVSHLSSLYGGYWNHDVLDFCYMTNRYFPPPRLIEDMQAHPASTTSPRIKPRVAEDFKATPRGARGAAGRGEIIKR